MYLQGETPLDRKRGSNPKLRSSAKVMPVERAANSGNAMGSMVKIEKLKASYEVLCGVLYVR